MHALIEGTKVCRRCKIEKPLLDYQANAECKLGVVSTCKICAYERVKDWYSANKKRRTAKAKLRKLERKRKAIEQFGDQCHDCGQTFPSCVYDFHHTTNDKEFNPSAAFAMTEDRRKAELEKCIMLCANCHRIRHWSY